MKFVPSYLFYDPWKNTMSRGAAVQYAYDYELPPKLVQIVDRWGSCFDEVWEYWRPRGGKKRKARLDIIKRQPLWLRGQRLPAEKWRRKDKAQCKLLL